MIEKGRRDYYSCIPLHNGMMDTNWVMGWISSAEQAALELKTLRARVKSPPMIPDRDLSPPLFMLIMLIMIIGTVAAVYFTIKEGIAP